MQRRLQQYGCAIALQNQQQRSSVASAIAAAANGNCCGRGGTRLNARTSAKAGGWGGERVGGVIGMSV